MSLTGLFLATLQETSCLQSSAASSKRFPVHVLPEHNRYCTASSFIDDVVERAVVEFDPALVMDEQSMERSGLRCRSSDRRRAILVCFRSLLLVTSMNPMLVEEVLRCIFGRGFSCLRWAHTCSRQRARLRTFIRPRNSKYLRWTVKEGHHACCRWHQKTSSHTVQSSTVVRSSTVQRSTKR